MKYRTLAHCTVSLFIALVLLVPQAMATSEDVSSDEADEILFAQAVELSLQDQWTQAESIYRDLLARRPQWPEPKNNLAILLLQTSRLNEAKEMLEQAVVSSPSYRIAQNNRSQLYNYLATQAYEKALGENKVLDLPELDLIKHIYLPVKVIEKTIEVPVEIPLEVIVEKPVPVVTEPQEQASSGENRRAEVYNHIQQQLLGWSRAWSEGDYEHYIESYADDFVPDDERKSLMEWKNIRKAKLTYAKNVQVSLGELRVFLEDTADYALVEFVQRYQSATYSDRVLKQMYMKKTNNNWRILSERVIKTF